MRESECTFSPLRPLLSFPSPILHSCDHPFYHLNALLPPRSIEHHQSALPSHHVSIHPTTRTSHRPHLIAIMSKDALDSTTPKKTDDNKVEQPWSDKERSLIVNHVLTHVLASVGYGNIFSELPDMLAKEGFPPRTKQAVSRTSLIDETDCDRLLTNTPLP